MSEETWLNDYVFTVDDFLSTRECEDYIRMSEEIGYESATLTGPQGVVLLTRYRNNDRVMFKNEEIAAALWERAEAFVPREFEGRHAVGVNELLRFYRYDPGQKFEWHQDMPYERDNGQQSFLTFMIYLNDDFQGGETSFDDSCSLESFDDFHVTPKCGAALFFEHATHHKGEPVLSGRKYVLRTDVMYASDDEFSDDDQGDEFESW